ncbi:hypothetical protein OUZ56_028417 [Daphnia magna]|uniref:Uncharacterized protein n=1 Tax=Daphnia magna TaxID=35525 RepID=A0ABR0B3T7_9CRUS|nr:hypothetical protein OUZ56_028417 [Daphnia magna]
MNSPTRRAAPFTVSSAVSQTIAENEAPPTLRSEHENKYREVKMVISDGLIKVDRLRTCDGARINHSLSKAVNLVQGKIARIGRLFSMGDHMALPSANSTITSGQSYGGASMEALRIIEAGRSTFFAFTVRFIRVLVNNVANSNDDSEKDKRGLLLTYCRDFPLLSLRAKKEA